MSTNPSRGIAATGDENVESWMEVHTIHRTEMSVVMSHNLQHIPITYRHLVVGGGGGKLGDNGLKLAVTLCAVVALANTISDNGHGQLDRAD